MLTNDHLNATWHALQKCLSFLMQQPPSFTFPSFAASINTWAGLPYLIGITEVFTLHLGQLFNSAYISNNN